MGSDNWWIISIPVDCAKSSNGDFEDTRQQLLSKFTTDIETSNLADLYPIEIPSFKVGSLDQVMEAADELQNMNRQFESSIAKIVQNIKTIVNSEDDITTSLIVNQRTPDAYVKSFQWNSMKYRKERPFLEIMNNLKEERNQIDNALKPKINAYTALKTKLASWERKKNGSLLIKDLNEIVTKDNFLLDSEYMETVLVVVPRYSILI